MGNAKKAAVKGKRALSMPSSSEQPSPSKAVAKKSSTPKKSTTKESPKSFKSPRSPRPPMTMPDDFYTTYKLVEELRADKTAPVDYDGAEALAEGGADPNDPRTSRFIALVALMFSSQTKDFRVGQAVRTLQTHGKDGFLTAQTINDMSAETLQEVLKTTPVGFHNNKTKWLKAAAATCLEKYDGDIPPTAETLMELGGVGPKMAHIIMKVAWDETSGIGVDTHMHRIFNNLKWVKSKIPEETMLQLEEWLPKEYWDKINLLWVGFGQQTQQETEKSLKKALACSNPREALKLMRKCDLDIVKYSKKHGLHEEVKAVMKGEE